MASSRKRGPLDAYIERSSEKGKPHPRVQSGPLRHSPATRPPRYSPVTGRKETRTGDSLKGTVDIDGGGVDGGVE